MPPEDLDRTARAARPKRPSPVERFLRAAPPRTVDCTFESGGEVTPDVAAALVTHGSAIRGWCYDQTKVLDSILVRYACEYAGRLHHREADLTLDGTAAGDLPGGGRARWRFGLRPGKELTFLAHGDLVVPLGELGVYIRFTMRDALEGIEAAVGDAAIGIAHDYLLELIALLHERAPDRVHGAFARAWPPGAKAPRDNALIVELWRRRRVGGLLEVVRPAALHLADLGDTIWAAD